MPETGNQNGQWIRAKTLKTSISMSASQNDGIE